jgi:hypothetical protein
VIRVGAVHWSMAKSYNPGTLISIFIGCLQIFRQPILLWRNVLAARYEKYFAGIAEKQSNVLNYKIRIEERIKYKVSISLFISRLSNRLPIYVNIYGQLDIMISLSHLQIVAAKIYVSLLDAR